MHASFGLILQIFLLFMRLFETLEKKIKLANIPGAKCVDEPPVPVVALLALLLSS